MEMPDGMKGSSSGRTAGGGSEPRCNEVNVVLSDTHLSEGYLIEVEEDPGLFVSAWRRARRAFGKEVEPLGKAEKVNVIEDFPHDEIFAAFLDRILEKYSDVDVLRLRLLGDMFDPLSVRWEGRFADPPYEDVAREKMGYIIRGHSVFFDALANFIRQPNAYLDFFVGNHDQHLAWPAVQKEIVRRLTGDGVDGPSLASKIRFIDHKSRFRKVDKRVLYDHGMSYEASTAINPETCIMTKRFGVELEKPVLNMPLSSMMTVRVVNRVKLKNKLVGRMHKAADLWRNAAIHRWGWGLYCGLLIVGYFLYNQFFGFWNYRRKSSLKMTLKIILGTISEESVDKHAGKLLKERDDIDVVVMAHTHEWRKVSSEHGTYLNTGTWALMFDLHHPDFQFKWKRFRRLEKAWKTFVHFLKTGEHRFAVRLTRFIFSALIMLIMAAFLLWSFAVGDVQIGSWHLADLKWPVGVLFCVYFFLGLVRVFSVKPLVRRSLKLTFGLIRHFDNGDMNAEIMEYLPSRDDIRECV